MSLHRYCNADWGVVHKDRKSISGYCVFLENSLISWSSKRQHVVSQSSTESEYKVVTVVALELSWIASLLNELKCPVIKLAVVWSDNIGAGSLSANHVYHSRSKHVKIDVHFIRDKVATKEIQVRYVSTYEQTTYCLTKVLSTSIIAFLTNKLGVVHIPTSLSKGVRA